MERKSGDEFECKIHSTGWWENNNENPPKVYEKVNANKWQNTIIEKEVCIDTWRLHSWRCSPFKHRKTNYFAGSIQLDFHTKTCDDSKLSKFHSSSEKCFSSFRFSDVGGAAIDEWEWIFMEFSRAECASRRCISVTHSTKASKSRLFAMRAIHKVVPKVVTRMCNPPIL